MTLTHPVLATAAADLPPAGAAALGEVLLASGIGAGLAGTLALLLWAHRSGRTEVLQRVADGAGRLTRQPGWVALPTLLSTASLLVALLGMYWDISLHIGQGRDDGPLANPAHYLILFGLFGMFSAGMLAVALPRGLRPGPAAVRVTSNWSAPVGGLLVAAAGLYALLGFPLDDVWHRLFGQDVTLWGPTHLMLIGGAGLSLVGMLVLDAEGRASRQEAVVSSSDALRSRLRRGAALGGLLLGLSVFQGEFDFGVPQFRLVLHPVLLTAAAGVALVAARQLLGRGGALGAAGFYVGVHALVAVVVGAGLDEVRPDFPLYLGSALVVEAVALLVARPLLQGLLAGGLIGSVGMATEYAWSAVAFRLPWGRDLVLEGLLSSVPTGLAAGALGALLALGLRGRLPEVRAGRVFVGALVVLAVVLGNGVVSTVPRGADVAVRLTEAGTRDGIRFVTVRAELPAGAAEQPSWVQVTAWQGGGLFVVPLEQGADGAWSSRDAVPVSGPDWKTLLRVQDGRALSALPLYLPADPVLGAPETPAEAAFTRPLQRETALLQRERDLTVPTWTFAAASGVVLAGTLLLVLALGWGVSRVSTAVAAGPRTRARTPEPVA